MTTIQTDHVMSVCVCGGGGGGGGGDPGTSTLDRTLKI